ncbi:bifunctional peptidase and arginyl-hydroxylase JMJD5 isoform X1 [Lucilia cuprina]|uniref:bifunctional peptidase and arginyl-hydroxylase JMJD5 isoform X1 n=1 Tax=Lucilia cuprina TaxID=7375 RepID=UPI001F069040|nr:bifunctional peptidase and arginyl-hydroxylase JMJD5 isoform X1 [Lucilia cuprina]
MQENITNLLNLLPNLEDINKICLKENEANYILKKASIDLLANSLDKETSPDEIEETAFLVQSLVDKCWERIHTGHFSKVPLEIRKIYALACYFKILLLLIESTDSRQLEKCSVLLDDAILIGCTQDIYDKSQQFKDILIEILDKHLDPCHDLKLSIIDNPPRLNINCDILQLNKPSVLEFKQKCFDRQQPALLLNTFQHWPALEKWRDLNYILKIAGNRTVPIEIGSNYANDEWSQQLMKIKDFLKRQFSHNSEQSTDIEYLAQHELFEQIPQLKKDFSIPDYCSIGNSKEAIDIKAWLGPKGTISPLHYDPKHNLLCQVFGSKSIILASPEDTPNLYPYEGEFLQNTSQIDAKNLDVEQFPRLEKVKFYYLTLQPGDCLYMPPKWWHYVQSNSPSFSVSFWWE